MFKQFLVLIFFLVNLNLIAQTSRADDKILDKIEKEKSGKPSNVKNDTLTGKDYKIFYFDGRTESIDTTLSIYKDYKFNFLRNFNIFPMHELIEPKNFNQNLNPN